MKCPFYLILGVFIMMGLLAQESRAQSASATAGGVSVTTTATLGTGTGSGTVPPPNGDDADGDGVSNYDELYVTGSDPTVKNTDAPQDPDGNNDPNDLTDGWPRVAWLKTARLPDVRYAVVRLQSIGLPSSASAIELDDDANVLAMDMSTGDNFLFWKPTTGAVETVPLLPWSPTSGSSFPTYYGLAPPSFLSRSGGHVASWLMTDQAAPSGTGAGTWTTGDTEATPLDPISTGGFPPYYWTTGINGSGKVVGIQAPDFNAYAFEGGEPGADDFGGVDYGSGTWLGSSHVHMTWNGQSSTVTGVAYLPAVLNEGNLVGVIKTDETGGIFRMGILEGTNFTDLGQAGGLDYLNGYLPGNRMVAITSESPVVALALRYEGTAPSNTAWWAHQQGNTWVQEDIKVWDPATQASVSLTDSGYLGSNDRLEIIQTKVDPLTYGVTVSNLIRNGVIRPLADYFPAGWTAPLATDINNNGIILANAAPPGASIAEPVLMVPVALQVDANRDGQIDVNDSMPTATKPFRFWSNDDDDGTVTNENEVYPVATRDCDDFVIQGRRDLEDMARLHVFIGGLSDAITAANPSIYVGLKWKNTTGSPAINIFPAVETDGGTKYLTDSTVATQQAPASTLRTTVLTKDNQYKRVDTSGTFVFNKDFWTELSASNPKKYLLFEGCTEGKGQLVLVFLKPDGTEIGEGPGVWIELKNIKSMYQRVKVTPRDPNGIPAPFVSSTTFDANGSGTESSDDGYPFAAPADETKTALVFVHGSNISYEEARWNAETMFKRLYWQGYKGRFVLFYWDTLIGPWDGTIPAHYNLNEYRALKYGWALKNYVESSLPSDYAHNVVGHSMGNAVIVSALRAREAVNGSTIPGMTARNVIFMQAAIPASCFDSGAATLAELTALENPQTTPDDVGQMGYRGVLETGVHATLFNIYNENDYALGWWVTNQRLMKPEDLLYRGYARKYTWTVTGGGQLWDWYNISIGPIRMRYIDDRSESMSFVARSRTAALGRMTVGGSISNNLNITAGTELDFGNERPDHSGEFTRRIHQLTPFYRYIFERAR